MLALCSLSGSDTQAAHTGKITPPFMNKSSWKQHAYFKKFYRGEQFSVTPVGWIMTSLILCTVGCKRRELYLDLHCSTALASTATRAFVHTCVPLWNFLKWKWCWPPVHASHYLQSIGSRQLRQRVSDVNAASYTHKGALLTDTNLSRWYKM